ncbi:zeta toxin family protein [Methylomonas sp. AM2-LC]|uniref:zeta toxin family protein n=1 Tax=Methylomonas sp. AM2-LC TaxID=3153301 RepID=UPI00326302CF
MIQQNNAIISGYKTLKKLRTVLAILQGTRLIATLTQEQQSTVSHDQTKRVTYLTALFTRIHREMYSDWKDQITVNHRPGSMLDAEKRKQFRETIERLVLDDENNQDTAIFDNNGFVIRCEDIAERLAGFYRAMRSIRPFSYGNRLALDFFITALGNLPAFKAVYEPGIDFRRLTSNDARALHDINSPHRQIAAAFKHALDPTRTKCLQNIANSYGKWLENKRFLLGIPFLSHTMADGTQCLVTVNGGLVALNSINVQDFIAGQHFADNPLSASEVVVGYLPGTEDLRVPEKTSIDAIPIRADGVAPLFGLDVNILTGLRPPSHAELLDLLRQCAGEQANLFSLAANESLKNRMLSFADDEIRLARTVEIAYERLNKINRILSDAVQTIFADKTPVSQPRLFMAMGGAGSGKTAVEEMAKACCGDNFVTASLDEFRKLSDLYRVMTAANHHSDDYVYIEPFANRLRDLVAQHAREIGVNILYDGTGIPYQPRYATIVKQFNEADFYTSIIAVDAFLVKPLGREEELSRSCVIESVKARYETTGRALPWVVTIDKHIRAPRSFLNALRDDALQKICLFANDGDKDKHYLVAESFLFTDSEVMELQDRQRQRVLADYLHDVCRNRHDSVLKQLSIQDAAAIEVWLMRNPAFNEDNVGYQIYRGGEINRVLLIYNTRRMIDFVEKRQLNPNASGEEGLLHKPAALAYHVDPYARDAWITRLQGTEA